MSEQEARNIAMELAVNNIIHSESIKSPIRNAFQQGWNAATEYWRGREGESKNRVSFYTTMPKLCFVQDEGIKATFT